MKKYLIIISLVILLHLAACSGDDPLDTDTVPPTSPDLIAHLGDTGDAPMIIAGEPVEITDDNNGIDADPVGDWINITWEPFIDNDLSHAKILRFSETDPVPVVLDSIPASSDRYQDQDPDLVEREWYSYYMELYDSSGNYSVSDTVSYGLLAKCNLYTPEDGASVSRSGLKLKWYRGDSFATRFRVLVWIEDTHQLRCSFNYSLATEDDPLEVVFPNLTPPIPAGTVLRWRVDAFDDSSIHSSSMGSESHERLFTLTD